MVKRHGEFTSMSHFTPVDPCFPDSLNQVKTGLAICVMIEWIIICNGSCKAMIHLCKMRTVGYSKHWWTLTSKFGSHLYCLMLLQVLSGWKSSSVCCRPRNSSSILLIYTLCSVHVCILWAWSDISTFSLPNKIVKIKNAENRKSLVNNCNWSCYVIQKKLKV